MRTRPPVPVCRGTGPSQAANSRPDRNAVGSPIAAATAVAVSTPTPGISATRWLSALLRCQPPIRRSILADLPVDLADPRPLLAQGLHDHRRQPLRDPRQGRADRSAYAGAALRHDLAVFGQQATQGVDPGGAELHRLLAHAVHRQDRLLLLALDRDRLHARLLPRGPDRLCVTRVVLVAGHEGPHRFRR